MSERALRLFVALPLPDEVVSELLAWRARALGEVDGLRLVSAEDLHVTLCFLGSVASERCDAVFEACSLAVSDVGAPELRLGGALWLPRRRPRVLSVGLLDTGGGLGVVQGRLSDALAGAGLYRPEARGFTPHVTVARVRGGARVRARELPAPAPLGFVGGSVVVFRSRLSSGGARYEALAEVGLG